VTIVDQFAIFAAPVLGDRSGIFSKQLAALVCGHRGELDRVHGALAVPAAEVLAVP
jgi:3-hydroxyisobutyrate dehydrogenase-like beta-hydroxyacid dehydrogenase